MSAAFRLKNRHAQRSIDEPKPPTRWSDPMSSDKVDMSNVGGRPKDWMQREHEKEVASNSTDGWKVFLSVGAIIALFVFAAWMLISVIFGPFH